MAGPGMTSAADDQRGGQVGAGAGTVGGAEAGAGVGTVGGTGVGAGAGTVGGAGVGAGAGTEGADVVVAVDGSKAAERALAWAARQAQLRGAGLTIAHACYWPRAGLGAMEAAGFLMDALEQDSREILHDAVVLAAELAPDVRVSTVSTAGPPVPTLVEIAKGHQVLVVGSRGLGGFTGMLLGSVGTGLVATATCPVAVVRGERIPAPGDAVVVGVDCGPSADAVLAEAFRAAERRHCPLVAVHCWQGPSDWVRTAGGRTPIGDDAPWERAATEELAGRMARVGSEFGAVRAEPVVRRGRAAAVLLELAADARLLVVGTRGRGEFKGMLLGSTSRAMTQHAPCPVLVVR